MIQLLISLTAAAFASTGGTEFGSGSTGNGGQGIVCGADDHSTGTSEAYDLFEGAKFFGYQYSEAFGVDGLDRAILIAHALDQQNPGSTTLSFMDRVLQVAEQVGTAPDQPGLPLTGDTDIGPTYMPVTCNLVQIIVFHTPTQIDVNQTAFAQLQEHSRAALYLHEAIYWYLRDTAGDTSSRRTRRIVSYLMSGGSPAIAVKAMGTYDPTPVYCETETPAATDLDHLLLLVSPAGKASLLILGAATGNPYELVLLKGGSPGFSLVANNQVNPAQNVKYTGGRSSQGELSVLVTKGSPDAQLDVVVAKTKPVQLPLLCAPYVGVLP